MEGLGKRIGTRVLKRDSSKVGEMQSDRDRAPLLRQRCHPRDAILTRQKERNDKKRVRGMREANL